MTNKIKTIEELVLDIRDCYSIEDFGNSNLDTIKIQQILEEYQESLEHKYFCIVKYTQPVISGNFSQEGNYWTENFRKLLLQSLNEDPKPHYVGRLQKQLLDLIEKRFGGLAEGKHMFYTSKDANETIKEFIKEYKEIINT